MSALSAVKAILCGGESGSAGMQWTRDADVWTSADTKWSFADTKRVAIGRRCSVVQMHEEIGQVY